MRLTELSKAKSLVTIFARLASITGSTESVIHGTDWGFSLSSSTTGWMVISPSNNGVVMAWLHFRFDKTIRRDREPATAQLQGGVRCAQTPCHNAHYIEREIGRFADQKQKLLLADRNQLGVAGSNCCRAARRAIDQSHFSKNAVLR